jgi:hypothetical protein
MLASLRRIPDVDCRFETEANKGNEGEWWGNFLSAKGLATADVER